MIYLHRQESNRITQMFYTVAKRYLKLDYVYHFSSNRTQIV